MPQAALNYTQQSEQSEKSAKIIQLSNRFCFSQMAAAEDTAVFDDMTDAVDESTHKGMNYFPADVYNAMIEYSLNHEKIRNAMLMICMANWGMRFSDVVRVRFGYLFDRNGQFKENFSLLNGEKKTSKQVVYYNNEATKAIIGLFLNTPEGRKKSRLDYLFTSESNHATKATVQELEANDIYDTQIESTKKEIEKINKAVDGSYDKYVIGKISDDEYNRHNKRYEQEKSILEKHLADLINKKKNHTSLTPDADKIFIIKPISHTTGERIIKETLLEIGINPKNRKDKSTEQTTNDKYNTHSLRKTFADWFIKTGDELNNSGELAFNDTIMDLLKEKFKHSSRSVTTHYTDAQEEAFKLICQNLNIGLDVVENYMYGG